MNKKKVRKMKQAPWKKVISLLTVMALCLSLTVLPAMAAEPTGDTPFVNVSEDGGENVINLTQPRSFKAAVPVDMTEDEAKAAAEKVVWSLDYDKSAGYLDPKQFPNHTEGGALDSWMAQNDEPLFTKPVTGVATVDGQVCLTVSFESKPFFYNYDGTPGLRGREDHPLRGRQGPGLRGREDHPL